jgi:hypothetical protein
MESTLCVGHAGLNHTSSSGIPTPLLSVKPIRLCRDTIFFLSYSLFLSSRKRRATISIWKLCPDSSEEDGPSASIGKSFRGHKIGRSKSFLREFDTLSTWSSWALGKLNARYNIYLYELVQAVCGTIDEDPSIFTSSAATMSR